MGWVHNLAPELESHSQWKLILVVTIVLTTLATITTVMRVYVRAGMLKAFGWDDGFVVAATVCSIIYNGLAIGQTKWGLGLDLVDRPKINLIPYTEINFTGRPFYMMGITFFKVSLCLSCLRIVHRNQQPWYRFAIWFVLLGSVLTHLAATLVLILQCKPVYKSWRPLTKGTCLPNDKTFYGMAANTIFWDIACILLPIKIFLTTKINNRRKVVLCGLFGLAMLTTLAGGMRMLQIRIISKTANSTMLVLWGTIEMNVGIITICIPTMAPLFKYFADRTTYGKNSNYPSNGYQRSRSRGADAYKLSNMSNSDKGPTTAISGKHFGGRSEKQQFDNESEEYIIGSNKANHGHIQQTTEITVQVEDDPANRFGNGREKNYGNSYNARGR